MDEKICEQILEYMKTTGDFILKETPEIVHQALKYHWISSLMGLFFSAFVIVVSLIILSIWSNAEFKDEYGAFATFGGFGPILVIFIMFMFSISCIDKMIKISYTPKYFIIDLFRKSKD